MPKHLAEHWLLWRLLISERLSVSLTEIRKWSLADVIRTHEYLDMIERAEQRELQKARQR